MKIISLILLLTQLLGCGFSPSKDDSKKETSTRSLSHIPENLDSDGDQITDRVEIEQGDNPYVADVPKVQVSFLQDYKIKVSYEDNSVFEINTSTAKDDPDFKYRVGNLFLKNNSLNNAARLGRFSGVSWGEIKQEDFTWVEYPQIDENYYFLKKREYLKNKSKKVKNIEISFENSLKLLESKHFKSLSDLELNFYYYSYSQESYVQLHTQKIEKIFQAGVKSTFDVVIENPPLELIEDSYMRHGKFIVSEIKDFYLPEKKMNYREFLSSIEAKTIKVYKTTPYENTLDYIAVSKEGESFINILSKKYNEKFSISENKLTQLEQFQNNLPSFKYLNQISNEDKTGKWFVMTNKINQHYLKYKFKAKDAITLSYITGKELSERVAQIIPSYRKTYSEDKDKKIVLGNISANSEVNISLFVNSIRGVKLERQSERFAYSPRRCRNCSGNDWNVWANFTLNRFKNFKRAPQELDLEDLKNSVSLYINNTKLDLEELFEKEVLLVESSLAPTDFYLHFRLQNLAGLNLIKSGQENTISLSYRPYKVGLMGEGIQINQVGGENINRDQHAAIISLQQSIRFKLPVSVTSWNFDSWSKKVRWNVRDRMGFIPRKGEKKKYFQAFDLDIAAKITNFYN